MVPGVEFHADRAAGDIAGVFRSDYKKSILRSLPEKSFEKSVEREKFLTYMKRCRTVFPVKIWSYMWKIWNLRR